MNPSFDNNVFQALVAAMHGGPAANDTRMAALITSPEQAYAVQDALVRALDAERSAADAPPAWKSGGPSRAATQTHSQLPAFGVRPSGSDMQGLHLRQPGISTSIRYTTRH